MNELTPEQIREQYEAAKEAYRAARSRYRELLLSFDIEPVNVDISLARWDPKP